MTQSCTMNKKNTMNLVKNAEMWILIISCLSNCKLVILTHFITQQHQ